MGRQQTCHSQEALDGLKAFDEELPVNPNQPEEKIFHDQLKPLKMLIIPGEKSRA